MTQYLTEQESMSRLFDANLANLNTAIPAEVVKYDRLKQTVDVKINFSEYLQTEEDTEELLWPELSEVPIATPQANGGQVSITMPVKPGDIVYLIFSQRSLDEWWQTEGRQKITPQDLRMHDGSDAVAILGPGTAKRKLPANASHDDNLVISVSDTRIIVKPDGTVTIEGSRLNIGSDSASTSVVVDKSLLGLGSWTSDATILINVMGGILGLIPATYPPLITPSITSSKAYTND